MYLVFFKDKEDKGFGNPLIRLSKDEAIRCIEYVKTNNDPHEIKLIKLNSTEEVTYHSEIKEN